MLTIQYNGKTVTVEAPIGTKVTDAIRTVYPEVALPCGGNGTCGKCVVQVLAGDVLPADPAERKVLGEQALADGMRLGCRCIVNGDVTVVQPSVKKGDVLSESDLPTFAHTETGVGIAVDIGTTTVAMRLYDRTTGAVLAERLGENRQRGYGADVISRITSVAEVGVAVLSDLIADQLEEMAQGCLADAKMDTIAEAVVTGNSTMLHLYEGLDPASLAVVPFDVQSFFGCYSRRTLAGAPVYLPRSVGAYVGADVVCSILASDMLHQSGAQLLADIGTNGEMALSMDGKLFCCATAAGPAFEGAGLKFGMPAAAGAIRAVELEDGMPKCQIIGNGKATGICGSGILDALRVMMAEEVLEDTGYLDEDYLLADEVSIVPADVRQIQLAKSAICAGVLTLLDAQGLQATDVVRFSLAGGFGSSLNKRSAGAIGLFPEALGDVTDFIGNGALGGAAMLLMNPSLRKETEDFATAAVEISLSASPVFMDAYIDCMSFMTF